MTKKDTPKPELNMVVLQLNSTTNKQSNQQQIMTLLDDVKSPDVILFPEVFNHRSIDFDPQGAESLTGNTIQWVSMLAQKYQAYIIAGSITETSVGHQSYNTCVVINPSGNMIETYRKIHLFDVKVNQTEILESRFFKAGQHPKVVNIYGWKFGLSICYDIRFPELYRYYFHQEVDVIAIPASFTEATGHKHWEPLCRARAIENQCYVLAPNQCGVGANGVNTYGNSLIVDPDGVVLQKGSDDQIQCISATLEHQLITRIRQNMPCHKHAKQEWVH